MIVPGDGGGLTDFRINPLHRARRFRNVDRRVVMRVCGDGENLGRQLHGIAFIVFRLCGPARGLAERRTSYY